eukprot:1016797-Alexandrium_andersonii.AAC.1
MQIAQGLLCPGKTPRPAGRLLRRSWPCRETCEGRRWIVQQLAGPPPWCIGPIGPPRIGQPGLPGSSGSPVTG